MRDCAICEKPLTLESDSKEHLIPNAVGGRRKITGFICKGCNSDAGETWDGELAKQLNPISLLLGISRERGEPPAQKFETTSGGAIVHESDGSLSLPKPIYKETPNEDGSIKVSITARDMDEAKRMLKGVKGKYPQIDVEDTMKGAVQQSTYPKDLVKIRLMFGGEIAGRSIVKTALALAASSGIPATACEVASGYLKNSAVLPQWEYYYGPDLILNRPAAVALHCVSVQARGGNIVGYVEYFGFRRMWVPLSDRYSGPDMQAVYGLDPVTGVELNLDIAPIPLSWHHSTIAEMSDPVTTALTTILAPAVKAAKDREMDRVLRQAWDKACEQLGLAPGSPATDEQKRQFAAIITKEIMPFLDHQLSDPFKNFKP